MRELREAIAKFRTMNVPEPAEIQVDSFSTIMAAFDRAGVALVADPKLASSSFMGVPVITNPILPSGFAAIVVGGKIECILDLRAAEESASQEGSEPS